MNKTVIYVFVPFVMLFISFMMFFGFFVRAKVLYAEACAHTEPVLAVLDNKTPLGACYWKFHGDDKVSEFWFNCGNNSVGDKIFMDRTIYTCR